ncbi:UDP-N-acetylmuramoyl-L-alanyl-D-glutamate--2,6-diaminopimelate ligase [Nakamurella sp. A5-74]|uniref:UDP-N-acetylmuramoyl-L-alanyl-D-glutamate--2,6-diaminopimelate ligase n=1 Tax=Nakamurella sp. A5-74 TaxID=3158264 RepID=A0AAU8DKC4_9ACTN
MSLSPLRPTSVVGVPLSALAGLLPESVERPPTDFGSAAAVQVTGASLRGHEVRPGDLFGALPGARTHGAQFAADAAAAGAVAVLTDPVGASLIADHGVALPVLVTADPRSALGPVSAAIYGYPSTRLRMIGVTGTSGKTTTCFLIEAALAAQGLRTGLIGTVMTRIGGGAGDPDAPADEVIPSAFTTPEAPDLQALLAVMVERGVQAVTMEVSSHALALGRVGGTRFAVGAFTNLSQDHLDFHPDMDDYFAAKAKLFDGRSDAAVVVIDDEWGTRLAQENPGALTVSTRPDVSASWRAAVVGSDPTGRQHLRLTGPAGQQIRCDLAIPGSYNVANALTAIACIDAAGLDPELAARALEGVQVPGRMQRIDVGQQFLAVIDYAHKPAAIAAVLDAVRGSVPGRVIAVIGAGGDRDSGKRALMGAAAVARADLVIVTDDNPRSEDPGTIRAAVLRGARGEDRDIEVREIGDRRAAIGTAVAAARPGDAVVIAGKGHETGQEIHGVKHPFSDEAELTAALRRLPLPGGAQ